MKTSFASVALWMASWSFSQPKPNILFIFSDDHAVEAVGAYRSWLGTAAKTPNIDRLATEGMRFDRALVTNSICGPSRAVIQTGKYSHINGFTVNQINSEPAGSNVFNGAQQTFPKILRANGYQTALIGKWHLTSDPQGYDYWDILNGQGTYYGPDFIRGNATGRTGTRTVAGYNTTLITDLALSWLSTQRITTMPFMLMAQYKACHREWEPGTGYFNKFDTVTIPEPSNLFDNFDYRGSAAHNQNMSIRKTMTQTDLKLANPVDWGRMSTAEQNAWNAYYNTVQTDFANRGFTFTDTSLTNTALLHWKYKHYLQDYLAVGLQMDDNIGRLLRYLDSTGLTQNTVVIYSSDQGFFLGEHGWFDKRWMYEESLRTPLIVRWPGHVAAGSVNKNIVSNLDFAETFLDIAGIAVPAAMQGRSILPILQGQTPANWRTALYYQYYEYPIDHNVYPHYGVTTDRYKLIYFHCINEWEFYDLKKDPNEMINQYNIPENAALINTMKIELQNQRTQLGVTTDAVCAASMTTVPLLIRTTPLPLLGCTNPNYQEYDPEATQLLAGSCRTPVTGVARGQRASQAGIRFYYRAQEQQVVVDVSSMKVKDIALTIHSVNGSQIAKIRPQSDGRFVWESRGMPSGSYIAEVQAEGKRRFFKLMK